MSEDKGKVYKAFREAQIEMRAAEKSAKNPHFRSEYATLADVQDACYPALHKHGFSVCQPVEYDSESGCVVVQTDLLHDSGARISTRLAMPLGKRTPHEVGSAVSYGRRYSLASLVGLRQADDDANAASGKPAKPAGKKDPSADFKREIQGLCNKVAKATDKPVTEIHESYGLRPGLQASELSAIKDQLLRALNGAAAGVVQ